MYFMPGKGNNDVFQGMNLGEGEGF